MKLITREEAQASVLSAHGLIEPLADPISAVRACIAVQTQYAMSLPVAVAARTRRHKTGWDNKALAAEGPLVKTWTLRSTLHAQTRADHALILAVVGRRFSDRYWGYEHLHELVNLKQVEQQILEAIAEGPLTRAQLHERVSDLKKIPYSGWGMDVMGLAFKGRICVIGRGAEQKFCAVSCSETQEDAIEELLRRYLRSYGPATLKDFSHWTGIPIGTFKYAVDALEEEIEPVEVAGLPGRRYMLRNSAIENRRSKVPNVRLLAKFDPLILAHSDKRLFFRDEAHRKLVFRAAGQVEAAVLVRGEVAGTWRMTTKGKALAITVEPHRRLSKANHAGLEREADRLAKALGLQVVELAGF